jgi:hypothetical protein
MPINPKLKEQLTKQIADATYRDKLIATLEDAPPEVQNNWMSQEDYTRQANELKTDKAKWLDFHEKTKTAATDWEKQVKQANDAVAAAQARILELETTGGGTRTPEQDTAVMAEIKKLSEGIAAVQTKFGSMVTTDVLDKKYQDAVGFIGDQLLTINEIQAEHQEKFGKRLTKAQITELVAFTNEQAQKGKVLTLDEAYKVKNADEIKKLEYAAWEKDYAEKHKTISEVPGAGGPGGPGPAGKGPLEIRIEQDRVRATGGTGDKGFTTWQEAAAAAGQELVNEGKY